MPSPEKPRPLVHKRGLPREVVFQRACQSKEENQLAKWQKLHSQSLTDLGLQQDPTSQQEATERPAPGVARRSAGGAGGNKGSSFETTYQMHGRQPQRNVQRYSHPVAEELRRAGVPRSSSDPSITKEMEGDHTRGIRGQKPHYFSTYMDLGVGSQTSLSRSHEVHLCATNRSAGVPPRAVPPKETEGDYSQGIRGSKPQYFSTYMDLGEAEQVPHWMGGKHQGATAEDRRNAGVPPREVVKKDMEGDHTGGIKGAKPHFFTAYMELGRHQKFDGKRYDVGAIAYKNYRLTIPTSRPASGAAQG